MLDDLGDVCLVSSSNLTRDSLGQVGKSTIHPVFPKDTNAIAEGRKVWLNHAEGSMDRPEDEEDDEEVVGVPKALKVGSSSFLRCRQGNCHE